jgi:phage terminase small subunit
MKIEKHNLQPQQQLAVSCYMKSINKTQAAKDTGYITTRVFDNPEVSAAIAEQLRVGADWVLAEAVRVYQRCMQTEKILDRDGNHTGEFKFDVNNVIKALALVGKHVDVKAFDQVVEAFQESREVVER